MIDTLEDTVATPHGEAAPVAPPPGESPLPAELDLGYQVSLDAFSGPLDLLLYLVRRTEVDIADIPIATIADQFIAALGPAQDMDMDLEVAGDFILLAATLLELKSRLVVPPEEKPDSEQREGEEDNAFDPRAGLIRQLLAYRRFKEATQVLGECEAAHAQRLRRQLHEIIPEDPAELDGIDLDNCDSGLLSATWESILAKIAGLGPRTVLNDDVPLETKIATLVDALRSSREARLSWLFDREPTRVGRVGMLMATLECARQRFVEALQHEQFGEVFLRYREDEERAPASDNLPPEPTEEPKRRRRRPPLVTWHPPAQVASTQTEADTEIQADDDAVEEIVETDEQRFLRELEEACAVESVLGRTADIDASFAAFVAARQAAAEAAAAPQPTTADSAPLPETPAPTSTG